jgi:ubiquinone/menaquinone biosynthesis C-methylase UbiE
MADPVELQNWYERRFAEHAQYRNDVWKVLTADFFQKYVPESATVLDVGCGWGEFSNNIRAAKKYGIDLNPDSATHLSPDVELLSQDCTAHWSVPDGSVDLVFTSNFFEHLESVRDITTTVHQAHRVLRQGGLIIALGPNIRHVKGKYWDFIDHRTPLTDASLAELFSGCGFTIEKQLSRFLPYTMMGGPKPPVSFVRLYLRVPLAWRVLGAQFLVVGRKQ